LTTIADKDAHSRDAKLAQQRSYGFELSVPSAPKVPRGRMPQRLIFGTLSADGLPRSCPYLLPRLLVCIGMTWSSASTIRSSSMMRAIV
jgi:hypothetical protein